MAVETVSQPIKNSSDEGYQADLSKVPNILPSKYRHFVFGRRRRSRIVCTIYREKTDSILRQPLQDLSWVVLVLSVLTTVVGASYFLAGHRYPLIASDTRIDTYLKGFGILLLELMPQQRSQYLLFAKDF